MTGKLPQVEFTGDRPRERALARAHCTGKTVAIRFPLDTGHSARGLLT